MLHASHKIIYVGLERVSLRLSLPCICVFHKPYFMCIYNRSKYIVSTVPTLDTRIHEHIETIKYREGLVPPIPIRYRCHCNTPIITEQQTQEWLQTNSTHSKSCHTL